ncbi:MAG TPA: serine protease [Candidatus Acidoferrum sp.]|nr:serine protease [Candidatus Acidoferrum sp.]
MRAVLSPACLLLAVTLIATRQSAGADELAPELLYQKVLPSVMTLRVESKSGERYVGAAFFAVKDDIAVTAWHVIYDAAKVTAKFPDGSSCEIDGYIDKDEVKDIAFIRVPTKGRPLATISQTTPLIGSRTYVIGSPKGYEFSISDGLLSQVQRVDGFNQYQVSCPFSPGNSGGPIVNSTGDVVGIAAWTRNGGQNVNFATPAMEVLNLKTDLPVKRWKAMPGRRNTFFSSDKKKSSPEDEGRDTAADLKGVFKKSVGEEITVTVQKNGAQEKFTFTVPSDFVK